MWITGDFIVVVNAEKIRVRATSSRTRFNHHHTGYIGNLKSETLEKRLARNRNWCLPQAVKGMLPKTKLGAAMIKKLKVYAGPTIITRRSNRSLWMSEEF